MLNTDFREVSNDKITSFGGFCEKKSGFECRREKDMSGEDIVEFPRRQVREKMKRGGERGDR
jgi:hypothetical protein